MSIKTYVNEWLVLAGCNLTLLGDTMNATFCC